MRRSETISGRQYGSTDINVDSYPSNMGYSSTSGRGTPEAHGYNVRLSDSYKLAYDIFSQLSDKQWLTRLESIASRAAVGSPSWTDELGITQDFQKRRIEAYNTAIADINNLLDKYYNWRNTLPVTQVQQASDAGVNLAVQGGIDSSEMSPTQSGLSGLSGDGSDSGSFISSAVSGVSSLMSSISSTYKSVQDVKLARQQLDLSKSAQKLDSQKFLSGLWKQLSDSGFDVSETSFNSFDDFFEFARNSSSDPEMQSRLTNSLRKYVESDISFAPLRSYFTDSDTGDFIFDVNKAFYDLTGSESMSDLDESMNLFAQYEMQTLLLDKLTKFNTAVYQENYTAGLDGSVRAVSENAVASMDRSSASLDELRNDINSEFIHSFADQWHKTKSPETRFALLRMISDLNLDDQSAMELIEVLGSPTLANSATKVIDELIDVGGDFAKRLSAIRNKRPKGKK